MKYESSVYSMPQKFIEDLNVPARWRVLAVLNGFFINNNPCWASNEWIAEKIGAHKDTASQGVKDLENLGLIQVTRGPKTRSIVPMIGTNAYLRSAPTPIIDRHQRLSRRQNASKNMALNKDKKGTSSIGNSVSNSVSEITAKAVFIISEEKPKQQTSKEDSRVQYNLLCSWLSKLTGAPIPNRAKQYKHLSIAKKTEISPARLKERANALWSQDFYRENGMDWGAVLSSFDRK